MQGSCLHDLQLGCSRFILLMLQKSGGSHQLSFRYFVHVYPTVCMNSVLYILSVVTYRAGFLLKHHPNITGDFVKSRIEAPPKESTGKPG